jgi:hypothetical protein
MFRFSKTEDATYFAKKKYIYSIFTTRTADFERNFVLNLSYDGRLVTARILALEEKRHLQ